MKDERKTKGETMSELERLQRRIAELEASEAELKQAKEELEQTVQKLRKALGGTVRTLVTLVENRDPYMAGHHRHVSDLARAIATEMGLSTEQIEGIRMAGGIHDLGKIFVPAQILTKPGKLSEIEFDLIKYHPEVGYETSKTVDFPWRVPEIILEHHERLDGSGYPRGLSGEKMLVEARILAVADVVEAMASPRSYRPALGVDKALEEMSQNKGILYDPAAVEACLRLFTEKEFRLG
jgi:HD-GYP domain-containing protein (c-di-GMP phosphodiesterase class II)